MQKTTSKRKIDNNHYCTKTKMTGGDKRQTSQKTKTKYEITLVLKVEILFKKVFFSPQSHMIVHEPKTSLAGRLCETAWRHCFVL